MSKIIIGIDPDSKAHGVAVYVDGKLDRLECSDLIGIVGFMESPIAVDSIEFHIEDVCAMNAVFRQKQGGNQAINMKLANNVGKCQQAQVELERFIEKYGFKIVKHKISKMWKKDKAQFEKVTGWTGRSNEDARSAAYFGWLGCR